MNLFRSEEHILRWLGPRESGATIPVSKLSELAHAWCRHRPELDSPVAVAR